MPVLKQLGPAQPKKRPDRGALSISAPLGDFRHTLLDLGPSMLDAVLGVMDAERPDAAAAKPDAEPRSGTQRPKACCRPNADLELDDVIGL
uniref:Cdc42 effector-like domain-containing protein n=1 Tax=Saimiri boliviensis boliviensis TaxID=39432 RepID=A0A2K6TNA6_SAIBB